MYTLNNIKSLNLRSRVKWKIYRRLIRNATGQYFLF